MKILGISAFYHDSAAVVVIDGKVATAIEEERFSRIKHDNAFPHAAIRYCLQSLGLTIDDIDAVAYYEKPLLKFERLLESFAATYPFALKPFLSSMPDWLGQKIKVEDIIRNTVGFSKKIYYVPHHRSHAAAAFYTSSFKRSAVVTVDGVGEYQTTALWHARDEQIKCLSSINFPHSIGLLYSTFTAFLGFKVNEDEFKVMGLAAYGKPMFQNEIRKVIDIKEDGSFALDMKYFRYRESFRMWSPQFERLFGPSRGSSDPIERRHKDIAASIQAVTEEIILSMLRHVYALTKEDTLCLSGGVALNALANGKIYDQTPFKRVHILGSAGDSGAAMGAALEAYFMTHPKAKHTVLPTLYLGSDYSDSDIRVSLDLYGLQYQQYTNTDDLILRGAKLLSQGKIIGWFQGKAEFGPRALGTHSILAKPNPHKMKDVVNRIKRREQFRPFAGSILQEYVYDYFHVPEKKHYSPFMNFCFVVKEKKRNEISAIVHEDNTCRIQTVNENNGRYYLLLKKYHQLTGSACILNTSFNLKGEPIVEHPRQAIEDFLKTNMDYLIIGNYVVTKQKK